MVEQTVNGRLIWALIVIIAAGIFAIRLSFLQLRGWVDEFPPALERSLAYLPASVLAALIFPALFTLDGTAGGVLNPRAFAASLAVVVAWRTKSMVATIVVGMGVLWITLYVVGY